MHVRNLYKTLAFYICVVLAVTVALGFFPVQYAGERDSLGFSAQRVSDDIRVIAKEPHSIQHPKARKVLGEFLFHRLQQMGGETQIIGYDTIPSKIGGEFFYSNIYSVFPPVQKNRGGEGCFLPDSNGMYILLVAHYDSRFRTIVGKDTVFSYGAADDGYGLGIIMELVSGAMKYRDEWKQGIKVLFTDAEEHNLDGMRGAWRENPEIFRDVNLVVNVEARGVKGPALLFETSPGNRKVMELYGKAQRPSGMSLTSFVYRFLSNDTDFSVVKDSIPGMNFAVIDNLKYYHTDLDNYSNISLESIQHYGDQLEPVLREYLVNGEYSANDAFKAEDDIIFFALPVLGLFAFSKLGWYTVNAAVFALFLFVFFIYVKYKMIPFKEVLKALGHLAVFAAGAFALGCAVVWVTAKYQGYEFSFLDLNYISKDYRISLACILVQLMWLLVFCRLKERRDKYYVWKMLLASSLLLFLFSLAFLLVAGENFFVLLPLATSSVAMFFSVARHFKWLYLVSCAFTVLLAVHFLYLLYVALAFGSLGVILMLAVIYSATVVSQYYSLKRRTL